MASLRFLREAFLHVLSVHSCCLDPCWVLWRENRSEDLNITDNFTPVHKGFINVLVSGHREGYSAGEESGRWWQGRQGQCPSLQAHHTMVLQGGQRSRGWDWGLSRSPVTTRHVHSDGAGLSSSWSAQGSSGPRVHSGPWDLQQFCTMVELIPVNKTYDHQYIDVGP